MLGRGGGVNGDAVPIALLAPLGEMCYLEYRLFDLVQTPSASIFDKTVLLSGSMT